MDKWPKECQEERCTYHTHYLRYGPPTIPHAAFHEAEAQCCLNQELLERIEAAGNHSPGLEGLVERLEKEVRA